MARDADSGAGQDCMLEEAFCAPSGAQLAGPVVALTFSYDYPEVVDSVMDSDFEVRRQWLFCWSV